MSRKSGKTAELNEIKGWDFPDDHTRLYAHQWYQILALGSWPVQIHWCLPWERCARRGEWSVSSETFLLFWFLTLPQGNFFLSHFWVSPLVVWGAFVATVLLTLTTSAGGKSCYTSCLLIQLIYTSQWPLNPMTEH